LLVAAAATAVAGSGLVPLVGRQPQGDSPAVPLALPGQRVAEVVAAVVALAAMGLPAESEGLAALGLNRRSPARRRDIAAVAVAATRQAPPGLPAAWAAAATAGHKTALARPGPPIQAEVAVAVAEVLAASAPLALMAD
jgi:hypothetical protein